MLHGIKKKLSKISSSRPSLFTSEEYDALEEQYLTLQYMYKLFKDLESDLKSYSNALEDTNKSKQRLIKAQRSIAEESLFLFPDIFQNWCVAMDEEYQKQIQIQGKNCTKVFDESMRRIKPALKSLRDGMDAWKLSLQQNAVDEDGKIEMRCFYKKLKADMTRCEELLKEIINRAEEAFVALEVNRGKASQEIYSSLCSKINADAFGGSEKVYDDQVQKSLSGLRSLSIVAD